MAKSFARVVHLNLYAFFFTILFLFLFTGSLLVFIPIYLVRFLVTLLRKVFRKDLHKLVTTRSAVIAGTDPPTAKNPKWNLCVWLVLEGKLDFEQFRVNFYNNIILKKLGNGQLHSPEFQQYLYSWFGFIFWKWEKDFKVEDHMRYLFPENTSRFVEEEELRQEVKKLAWEPFRKEKSPWEFLYVPNYQDGSVESRTNPGKSVLIFRVHHSLCDGFSILHLLMKEVNGVSLTNVAKPDKVRLNVLQKILRGLLFWISAPYLFMKMMVRTSDTNEWHLPSDKLKRPYNMGYTERIPLDYIKEIKNIHKVSFTAVIYSCISGAIRRAMVENGKKIPQYMSTAVAVPMAGHPQKLRNHFIFSFLQLPTGIEDPLQRLQKVERNVQRLKLSPVPLFNFGLIPLVGGTIASTMKFFSCNNYSTMLTSNFPGPPDTVYFIGGGGSNRVMDMNFAAGLGEGGVGFGFCMMSYDEGMRIVSNFADAILSTDAQVDLFNQKIMEEMEILRGSSDFV